MTWKLGMLWGALLTIIEWLIFLAGRGGGSVSWFSVILLVVFIYVGFSSYRLSRSLSQAAQTTMLAGLVAGFFGSLTVFLGTPGSFWSLMLLTVEGAFASALLGVVLGLIGGTLSRMRLAAREK